jgi:outer membrane protein assembly factor BamB
MSVIPTPVLAAGKLYVPGDEFVCLQPVEGQTEPVPVWKSSKIRTGMTSPLLYEGKIYGLNNGVLVCADATDGKELWRKRLTGKYSGSSPFAANGHLYVVSDTGATTSFKLTAGEPLEVSRNELGEDMLATPAVSGGAIFLRSDAHLFCVADPKK